MQVTIRKATVAELGTWDTVGATSMPSCAENRSQRQGWHRALQKLKRSGAAGCTTRPAARGKSRAPARLRAATRRGAHVGHLTPNLQKTDIATSSMYPCRSTRSAGARWFDPMSLSLCMSPGLGGSGWGGLVALGWAPHFALRVSGYCDG